MINEEWVNNIKDWLEDGEDLAENIIDIPWEVEVSEGEITDALFCSHPSTPFDIMIIISKEFAALYLNTRISTDTYDNIEKMRFYKKLLKKNLDFNLAKTAISSDTDDVVVCVDLDLSSLGKTEFNNALDFILYASTEVFIIFDLKNELYEWFYSQIKADCTAMYEEGKKKGDISEYLMNKVGWEKENAQELAEELIAELEKEASNAAPKPITRRDIKTGPPLYG